MTLTVSVILPTHDRPAGLAGAVDSILAQTRRPAELIVVDDGTTPADTDIGERVEKAGVRFIYERRSRPCLPASRNRGLDLADGDIVVFGEDDVAWPEDFLERLVGLYRADGRQTVAAIGAVVIEPDDAKLWRRIFDGLAGLLGRGRWSPRRSAARYVTLPEPLRCRLLPARRLSGGAMSLRMSAVGQLRFDESLGDYALGEDREFCFRLGALAPIFIAPELRVFHCRAGGGQKSQAALGRMYVSNTLHIAGRSTEGGAGTWLLVAYELGGAVLLYLFWSIVARRRGCLAFAFGGCRELLGRARAGAKEILCGS